MSWRAGRCVFPKPTNVLAGLEVVEEAEEVVGEAMKIDSERRETGMVMIGAGIETGEI